MNIEKVESDSAVGPGETVKKPSGFCEALFKPLWESAVWADFHQWRQFPQAFRSFFFAPFFFLHASTQFSTENFASGGSRSEDSHRGRPLASPVLASGSPFHRLAVLFLQRPPETIGLGSGLDDMGLIGQAVQHGLAQPRVREHRRPLRKG